MVLGFGFLAFLFVVAIPRIPSAWKSPDPDMQAGVLWWAGSVVVLAVTLLAIKFTGEGSGLTRLLVLPAIVASFALVATTFVLGGGEVTDDLRADLRIAACYATDACREVAQWAHLAAGTAAIRDGSRLERAFRDLYTGTQHAFIGEKVAIDAASVKLGVVERQRGL